MQQIRLQMRIFTFEAESVAYTVAQHFGIETSDYSFAYIAGWSAGKDTPELKASLDRIRKAADEMIAGIDEQLQVLQKEKVEVMEMTAEDIAIRLDELSYAYDYYGYTDAVEDSRSAIQATKEMLLEGGEQTQEITDFLQEIIDDNGEYSAGAAALMAEVKAFSEEVALFMPPKNPDPPVPGLQENGAYRYYSTQRPVDLGTFPKPPDNPVVEIHNFDADSRVPVENGMIQAWGYVEYQKPLTEQQASDYELRPAPAKYTEKEVAQMAKSDIASEKADIRKPEPDIGRPDIPKEAAPDHEVAKKSVLKDLETAKPKPRNAKTDRKPKKQKEETR